MFRKQENETTRESGYLSQGASHWCVCVLLLLSVSYQQAFSGSLSGCFKREMGRKHALKSDSELEDRMVAALHLQHPDSEHNCGRGSRAIFKGTERGESVAWHGGSQKSLNKSRDGKGWRSVGVSNSEEFNSQLKTSFGERPMQTSVLFCMLRQGFAGLELP